MFQLSRRLGQEPENNDVITFGLLPIFLTLYHESRGLLVRWVE